MSIKPISVPTKTLAASITAAATSFRLNNIVGWDSTNLVSGDFGSQHYVVFRNAARTQIEIMEIDPATIASASITILRRGLDYTGDLTTEITANKFSWTKGDTFVDLGTDTPQLWQWLKEYIDAAAIAGGVPSTTSVLGLVKMSTAPVSAPSPIAVGDNDTRVPTQAENDALAGFAGTPSGTNPYAVKAKNVTAGATINGATLPVPVYQNTTDNEYYACDGNDLAALKFQGFAVTNGTDGNSMNVQFTGVVSGFTGLDEGVAYWLSDTAGTIQNTPGTYHVLVGIAISTTELLIQKGKRYFSGNGGDLGTASGSLAVSCGFRPNLVRIYAVGASTSYMSTMVATWANGVLTGVGGVYNEASSGGAVNAARAYMGDTSTYFDFTITTVTNTGFTIVWTETGTAGAGVFFAYDVEGEI